MEVVARVLAGDRAALARLLRSVDDGEADAVAAVKELFKHGGRASYVGITGSGGSGKSTLADGLIARYRRRGQSVGVVAVDPSSPFSGGAILGDRLRMQRHGLDQGVFIRSLANHGHLGGLSPAALASAWVLDAAGFEVIIVETVGVGQAEVEVASLASTTLVVTTPDTGDQVQALKAGVVEVADVVVANKADKPGAQAAARELASILELGRTGVPGDWCPPVVSTVGTTREGLGDLVQAIDEHEAWLSESSVGSHRAVARWRDVIFCVLTARVREKVVLTQRVELHESARRVARRESDPFTEADELLRLALTRES